MVTQSPFRPVERDSLRLAAVLLLAGVRGQLCFGLPGDMQFLRTVSWGQMPGSKQRRAESERSRTSSA
jgi:hypothetical protein